MAEKGIGNTDSNNSERRHQNWRKRCIPLIDTTIVIGDITIGE